MMTVAPSARTLIIKIRKLAEGVGFEQKKGVFSKLTTQPLPTNYQ
jgi:hypothetical protein